MLAAEAVDASPAGPAGLALPTAPRDGAGDVGPTTEPTDGADLERRFGGLRRLYGAAAYRCLRAASVAVVGLGGVGSWAAEALARSGVARLVLIDLDHVSESNVNRQVQALGCTLGQHKGDALRDRIADIHPGCAVQVVDAFVGPDNWPALLTSDVHVVIDACDQPRAKLTLAAWSLRTRVPLVCVGAAGGKRQAQRVEVEDLADTTHDPLLASLRQRLRKEGAAPRQGRIGLRCVFSREAVSAPGAGGEAEAAAVVADVGVGAAGAGAGLGGDADGVASEAAALAIPAVTGSDGSLNCHGYGSSVAVTATFGMVAAGEAIDQLLAHSTLPGSR